MFDLKKMNKEEEERMITTKESINGFTCITIGPDENEMRKNTSFRTFTTVEQFNPVMFALMALNIREFSRELYKREGIKEFTEFAMATNWKALEHHQKSKEKDDAHDNLAQIYAGMWGITNQLAHEMLTGDDLKYYLETTD